MNKFIKYLKERRYHGDISNYKNDLGQFESDFEKTFNYIGIFLNQNIIIEQYLDDILELHLAKNRSGINGAAFKSLLLNGRFFSIHEKQKMFGDLTKSTFLLFNLVRKDKSKNIRKLISEVIAHRNIIAHNRFGIDVNSKNPIFKYYEGGKIKEYELSEEKMGENLDNGNIVIEFLQEFKIKLKKHEDKIAQKNSH
ncbi:hypothetical protein [Portibacter lacus]|uniref:RiboL-PSP-HEPN domain-containing protein n=1 Tax=Portibacter lacus TaxID=1099794 RepID=A0AA37SLE9_9BACT|nr:hypothetical protein [Portibacter lacus]GLR16150.1 hypothetical protein GCM10007940_07650 [Portibacter lacus]